MKLFMRGGIAAMAIAGAAIIAVGCGGSGGSGATAAAKDSKALDLVPKNAIGYVTIDTDLEGDNWEQFNDLAAAFDADFKGVAAELEEGDKSEGDGADGEGTDGDEESKDEDAVDFKKDIDPWLGESAGAALLSAKEDGDFFVWADVEDSAKLEAFAKQQGWEKGDKIGDYETLSDPDDDTTHVAYTDELALMSPSRKSLEARVEYDGDSVTDADGVGDAVDEVEGDALVTLVVSGEGVRKAIADTPSLKSVKDAKQLKDFKAAAMSVSAEDNGMRLSGFVGSDGESESRNVEHPIFNDLPGNTVFALGGHDLGGTVETIAKEAGKENAQVQQGVGAAEAALGIDMKDLAAAWDGEFVLGMSADDKGLGSLAGGVAGAAMGGGLGNLDPGALAKSVTIILAFEETGKAGETLEKVVSSGAGLAGASGNPLQGTSGDFETKELSLGGFPVTTATSDDVAALQVGVDVLDTWGDESLADNETFKDAWDAAEGPDESAGLFWFDAARVAKLAGVESGEDVELGGFVGWVEADGSNGKFGAFLHIEEQ